MTLTLSFMAWKKAQKISEHFSSPSFDTLLRKWYVEDQLSGEAIAQKITSDAGIPVTSRAIYLHLQRLGFSRPKSDARKIGILKGRVDYSPLRKPIKSIEWRKGISLKVRYQIMQRDNFRCVLCGADSTHSRLVIDHIIPVVHGGTNELSNLRTLCQACNHGKKMYEKER